jgi:hypothetical protein
MAAESLVAQEGVNACTRITIAYSAATALVS